MHGHSADWQDVHAQVLKSCLGRGLDIVHAFGIEHPSPAASAVARLGAPDFGRQRSLGLVIGNTRALWPVFQRQLLDDAGLRAEAHPLDAYVVRAVEGARADLPLRSSVHWAHGTEPRPIPIQRIAQETGLAHVSPSHLSIHRRYGPWIALRAVLSFDVEGPGPLPSPYDPCSDCTKPCLEALRAALATSDEDAEALDVAPRWRAWLAIRDACPEGRSSRYGDEQLSYHYTKQRRWLFGGES